MILIVVASFLALGAALLKTGAADYLAQLFVMATAGTSPTWLLSGLMLLMALMTNIVSNNAAALIGTLIAIGIVRQLGLAEEPFVLAVLFGANMSGATPIAYKTNLLVMSAGGYRFGDFLRVGLPLTLIMWAASRSCCRGCTTLPDPGAEPAGWSLILLGRWQLRWPAGRHHSGLLPCGNGAAAPRKCAV